MDLGLHGTLALVTGGGSRIGWHTAQQLLVEGATVVVSDIDQIKLDAATAKLDARAGRLYAYAADVTDVGQLTALHQKVAQVGSVAELRPGGPAGQLCVAGVHPHSDDRRDDGETGRTAGHQRR